MSELSPAGKTLLEAADSEAKRVGLAAADFWCLAAAISRRSDFDDALESLLGEGVQQFLASRRNDSDTQGDRDELVGALRLAESAPTGLTGGLLQDGNPFREWLTGGESKGSSGSHSAELLPLDEPETGSATEAQADAGQPAGQPAAKPIDPVGLVTRLKARVIGQDEVIDRLVRRLAITRAELDLRPERPDGAFLFVGPTGVGKTELARAIAVEVFGDDESLIRLDMSEYAHDWSISRLTGPMPGYVGSDQPQSWLTTRVRQKPESVLLLDEVEKAHPAVWNVFLQALDAGRLTDSKGKEADFSRVIVVMTSNLGSQAFTKAPVGFADRESEEAEREAREATGVQQEVRTVLPPELINRLDAILNFRALEKADIRRIAELEVSNLAERLAARGIEIEVSNDVTTHIAEAHYDRRYGARHLQRNIEAMLVEPIALNGITSGEFRASLVEGLVQVQAS